MKAEDVQVLISPPEVTPKRHSAKGRRGFRSVNHTVILPDRIGDRNNANRKILAMLQSCVLRGALRAWRYKMTVLSATGIILVVTTLQSFGTIWTSHVTRYTGLIYRDYSRIHGIADLATDFVEPKCFVRIGLHVFTVALESAILILLCSFCTGWEKDL
mmetsp:Transcript_20599/g.37277  ORF Transcript_20599/g.37277 Transcript_20599/m.37277 type:complete len:159 (+) Transcript_20599:165-641(+)